MPLLRIVSGDNQTGSPGQFNAAPMVVSVENSDGNTPLANAPVIFTVQTGDGQIAVGNLGTSPVSTKLKVTTDANGIAQVYFWQPATLGVGSNILVTAGSSRVTFTTTTPADTDKNGLPDDWEIQYFGHIGNDPNADPDGDGLTTLQEFQQLTDPTDFFNGTVPIMSILSGNNQTGLVGQFNAQPFVIQVANTNATVLINATVTFTVQSGSGQFGLTGSGTPTVSPSLTLRTDSNGRVSVYFQQPSDITGASVILATAGQTQVYLNTTNNPHLPGTGLGGDVGAGISSWTGDPVDSDHNGLADSWEFHYFGHIGVDPNADATGDDRTNLQDFQNGIDPTIPHNYGKVGSYVATEIPLDWVYRFWDDRGILSEVHQFNNKGELLRGGYLPGWGGGKSLYTWTAASGLITIPFDPNFAGVYAINDKGDMAGFFISADRSHNFPAIFNKDGKVISNCGSDGDFGRDDTAVLLNNNGGVAGLGWINSVNNIVPDAGEFKAMNDFGEVAGWDRAGFIKVWNRHGQVIASLPNMNGSVHDMNNLGQAVGEFDPPGHAFPFLWNFHSNSIIPLSILDGPNADLFYVNSINKYGVAVGYSGNRGVFWLGKNCYEVSRFLAVPISGLDLSVYDASAVSCINDNGQMIVKYYHWADATFVPYRTFLFTPLQGELAVDTNRDGTIKLASEDDSDTTSAAAPFRFWLNDDIDRSHTVDGNDTEEDDLGGTEANGKKADSAEGTITSKRDLEDYSRLWISTQGLNDAFKDESNALYLGLQWTDTGDTTPAIRVFKHVEIDGGTKYLTDDATADLQSNLQLQSRAAWAIEGLTNTSAEGLSMVDASDKNGRFFVFPKSLFSSLTESTSKTCLLFEGVQAGKGQLRLVILKKENETYTKIGDGPGVWMDLKKIEDMYERWTVGDTSGGTPWSAAVRKKTVIGADGNVSSYNDGFTYADDAPEEKKYILYVHGWNMQPWEKNRFAETAFKRLWRQGYKGRFGLFAWPTTNRFDPEPPFFKDAATDPTNYDRGEWTAWKSATPLCSLLQALHRPEAYGDQVYVLAHSMGNVVTGEALRLASQQGSGRLVNTYVASQAAIPVHVYDGSSTNLLAATGPGGIDASIIDVFPQTPNTVYPDWLAGNGAAAGTRINFYNVNDYALWNDHWQLNQYMKPDHKDAPDQPWNYTFETELGAAPDLHSNFIRFDHYDEFADPAGIQEMQLGTQAAVGDRYEIMAFVAESRSMALGATPSAATLTRSVDLTLPSNAIWPTDTEGDARSYSRHKWHSAQFRSTNMRQQGYWRTLLGPNGFNLSTTP